MEYGREVPAFAGMTTLSGEIPAFWNLSGLYRPFFKFLLYLSGEATLWYDSALRFHMRIAILHSQF